MSITYLEAIRDGQDVGGTFGGAFKATKGLAKEFPGRVLNTPISEDAMVGTAIGAAMEGMRPIVEMQFADFSSIALNQILNNAGTVEDAYTMLIEAVAIDDPVVYCEHKYLYYHLKADRLPSEGLPVGQARIARVGRDLTIVSYSAMLHESLAAAEKLAGEGFEV